MRRWDRVGPLFVDPAVDRLRFLAQGASLTVEESIYGHGQQAYLVEKQRPRLRIWMFSDGIKTRNGEFWRTHEDDI